MIGWWETGEGLRDIAGPMGGARWRAGGLAESSGGRGDWKEGMTGGRCGGVERWGFEVLFGEVRDRG